MEQPSSELFSLQIEPITRSYLSEATRWARFLAIVGFVICGLVALMGIFASTFLSYISRAGNDFGSSFNPVSSFGAVAGFMYVCIALLYFFPCLYLFRFSSKMKTALASGSQQDLNTSFQNLKSMFKFVGILTIIVMTFYVLAIAFAVVVGVSMRH